MNQRDAALNGSSVMKRPYSAHDDLGRWWPWDAMRRACPNAEAVAIYADVFGYSPSLVEKMRHPHGGAIDQGRKSIPARIHEAITRCHREVGVPLLDAAAIIRQPANKLGFRLRGSRRSQVPADASLVLPALNRTTGELAAYLTECLADNQLDALERVGLRKRLHAALDAYIGVEVLSEVYPA